MQKLKFPKTIAALQAYEMDQWAIGDALIEECGPPREKPGRPPSGDHENKLADAAKEARANGLKYAEETLRKFWMMSHRFKIVRHRTINWSVCAVVPNPEWLDLIIKAKGENVTVDEAEQTVVLIRAQNLRNVKGRRATAYTTAKAKGADAEARKRKAEEAAQRAASEEERREAEQEAARAKWEEEEARQEMVANQEVPDKDLRKEVDAEPLPEVMDIPRIGFSSSMLHNAHRAVYLASQTLQGVELRGEELTETNVDALMEVAINAQDYWHKVVTALRTAHGNKRGHLSIVVNE